MALRLSGVALLALGTAGAGRGQSRSVPAPGVGAISPQPKATAQPKTTPAKSAEAHHQEVAGRVYVLRDGRDVNLGGAWVTLHRVGASDAGPVDSVRSDSRGRFRFIVADSLDGSIAYFVSAPWAGLTNFSARISTEAGLGSPVDLALYDTTSTGPPVPVASRHIVVGAPRVDGTRTVNELFVLLNGSGRTRISSAHRPSFDAALPDGVMNARSGTGDIPAAALSFSAGQVRASAPIPPGATRVAIEYDLARGAGRLSVPPNRGSDLVEILVEDSAGVASGPGLREEAPAAASGRLFRRFLANNAPDTARFAILLPAPRAASGADPVLVVVGVVGVVLAGVLFISIRRADERTRSASRERASS